MLDAKPAEAVGDRKGAELQQVGRDGLSPHFRKQDLRRKHETFTVLEDLEILGMALEPVLRFRAEMGDGKQ